MEKVLCSLPPFFSFPPVCPPRGILPDRTGMGEYLSDLLPNTVFHLNRPVRGLPHITLEVKKGFKSINNSNTSTSQYKEGDL